MLQACAEEKPASTSTTANRARRIISPSLGDDFDAVEDRFLDRGAVARCERQRQVALDLYSLELPHHYFIPSARFLRHIESLQHWLSLDRHIEVALSALYIFQ